MSNQRKPTLSKNPVLRLIIYGVMILGFGILVIWIFSTRSWLFLSSGDSLDVNLHSERLANYAADPLPLSHGRVKLSLIDEAIIDLDLVPEEAAARIDRVQQNLKTPVPTITPQNADFLGSSTPSQTRTTPAETSVNEPSPTQTATAEQIAADSPTPGETTGTLEPSPTATSTTRPPSSTPIPPTATSAASTSTPGSSTETSFPPTNTSVPPTDTAIPPSDTQVTPSDTPIPPTQTSPPPTNTTSPCSQVSLSFSTIIVRQVIWKIDNNSSSDLTISEIQLSWPETNEELDFIICNGVKIWDGSKSPPSATISSGWIGSANNRTAPASDDTYLRFRYEDFASWNGYTIQVNFSNGCSASSSK